MNDAHVCVTTILLGTRQPPDDRWWGLQRGSHIPVLVRGSDRSILWPTSSFAHPIPRVILALGIKAIADSSIAASCKKFANQLDSQFTGDRCTVVVNFRCPDENLDHPSQFLGEVFLASVLNSRRFTIRFSRMAQWMSFVFLVVVATAVTESKPIPAEPSK